MNCQIEVSTFCNADCKHCEHTYWNEVHKNMSFDDFKLILDSMPVEHLDLSGIGENLCNPEWNKILEYACEKVGSVEFTTNLLQRQPLDLVKKYKPRINCSMNAGDIDNVLEKLRELMDITEVSVNYVLTKESVKNVASDVDKLKGISVKNIQFINIDVFEDNKHLALSDEELENFGANMQMLDIKCGLNNAQANPPTQGSPFITVDGYVLPTSGLTQSKDRTSLIETYAQINIIHRIKAIIELQQYSGEDANRVSQKVDKAAQILNTEWFDKDPKTENEIKDFYKNTEYMLYDLMAWGRPRWINKINKYYTPDMKVLDYGCGTGEFIIGMSNDTGITRLGGPGSNFFALDIKDSHTQKFANWRFKQRGLNPEWVEEPMIKYDMILCMDVFEHVPNPIKLLQDLYNSLKKGGYLVISLGFHDNRPLHISHDEFNFRKELKNLCVQIEGGRPEIWQK